MFQRKKKEVEPTPLSDNDIKKLKTSLDDLHELKTIGIKDLDLGSLVPQAFEYVVVGHKDEKHTLFLDSHVTGEDLKKFRKTRGGVFNRDYLSYLRGKPHGKYVLITEHSDHDEKMIVRLIEDEELHIFEDYKLVDGIIKDKPYMVLKILENGKKLTSYEYIEKENRFHEDADNITEIDEELEETSEDDGPSSVSLFDE